MFGIWYWTPIAERNTYYSVLRSVFSIIFCIIFGIIFSIIFSIIFCIIFGIRYCITTAVSHLVCTFTNHSKRSINTNIEIYHTHIETSLNLLFSAVPACPAHTVPRHITPVDIIRPTVPVQSHDTTKSSQRQDDIGPVFRVQRDSTNVRLTSKQHELWQTCRHKSTSLGLYGIVDFTIWTE